MDSSKELASLKEENIKLKQLLLSRFSEAAPRKKKKKVKPRTKKRIQAIKKKIEDVNLKLIVKNHYLGKTRIRPPL